MTDITEAPKSETPETRFYRATNTALALFDLLSQAGEGDLLALDDDCLLAPLGATRLPA